MYPAEKMLQLLYRGYDKHATKILDFLAEDRIKKKLREMLDGEETSSSDGDNDRTNKTLRLIADVLNRKRTNVESIHVHEYIGNVELTEQKGRPPMFIRDLDKVTGLVLKHDFKRLNDNFIYQLVIIIEEDISKPTIVIKNLNLKNELYRRDASDPSI